MHSFALSYYNPLQQGNQGEDDYASSKLQPQLGPFQPDVLV
jgi:hypothetical protein